MISKHQSGYNEKRITRAERSLKRAEREKNEMLRKNGDRIKFDFWGWTPEDETPFLVCRIYFKKPIKPIIFLDDLKGILNDLFHEHL